MSKNRQTLRPVDVANWLKQNPTVDGKPVTINDGKLAVGWPEWEKALKIKKGDGLFEAKCPKNLAFFLKSSKVEIST